jgi:hypothetical protein
MEGFSMFRRAVDLFTSDEQPCWRTGSEQSRPASLKKSPEDAAKRLGLFSKCPAAIDLNHRCDTKRD